jgi:hypothetical protein
MAFPEPGEAPDDESDDDEGWETRFAVRRQHLLEDSYAEVRQATSGRIFSMRNLGLCHAAACHCINLLRSCMLYGGWTRWGVSAGGLQG